jgi:hypothetical protein
LASYRLIDEMPGAKKRRPPYSPLGIFLLTWLYLPLSAPFWIINWGRLGHPEKRLLTGVMAVAVFALPFVWLGFYRTADVGTISTAYTLGQFAFAYFQLYGQRPLYQRHILTSGEKAAAWPLWVTAVVAVAIQIALALTKPVAMK